MIRDGAAWYSVEQKSGQEPLQSEIYQKPKRRRKLEKLGVWSLPDLKPSWQIRAERAGSRKTQEIAAREKPPPKPRKTAASAAVKPKTRRPVGN